MKNNNDKISRKSETCKNKVEAPPNNHKK